MTDRMIPRKFCGKGNILECVLFIWPLNSFSDIDYVDTWKAMEQLVALGLAKSIGISNFNQSQVERLLANCTIKPANNQIEVSPAINQRKLVDYCNERDIVITAYCPLGRPQPEKKLPAFLHDAQLKAIADKYKKTPAQIIFRYLVSFLCSGVVLLNESTPKRLYRRLYIMYSLYI